MQCRKNLHVFEKLRKADIGLFISIRLFVRTSINSALETIQLPLGEYSWNFMLEDFLKNCHENSGVIKIQEKLRVIYMKTCVHF